MTDDAPYDIKQKVEHPSLNPDLQTSGVKVVTITVSDLASLCAERDHAQAELQAAVAAEREACAECCTAELRNTAQLLSNPPQSSAAWDARNAIRARANTDAQAALEAVKREARNEALREAMSLSWLCFHRCNDEVDVVTADDILALIEDTDDE